MSEWKETVVSEFIEINPMDKFEEKESGLNLQVCNSLDELERDAGNVGPGFRFGFPVIESVGTAVGTVASPPSDPAAAANAYQVWSTVLGKAVITLYASGYKKEVSVYAGGMQIAVQVSGDTGGSDTIDWPVSDPVTGTHAYLGGISSAIDEEREPMGQLIALTDPGVLPPPATAPGKGSAGDPEWQCMQEQSRTNGFSGSPLPCFEKYASLEGSQGNISRSSPEEITNPHYGTGKGPKPTLKHSEKLSAGDLERLRALASTGKFDEDESRGHLNFDTFNRGPGPASEKPQHRQAEVSPLARHFERACLEQNSHFSAADGNESNFNQNELEALAQVAVGESSVNKFSADETRGVIASVNNRYWFNYLYKLGQSNTKRPVYPFPGGTDLIGVLRGGYDAFDGSGYRKLEGALDANGILQSISYVCDQLVTAKKYIRSIKGTNFNAAVINTFLDYPFTNNLGLDRKGRIQNAPPGSIQDALYANTRFYLMPMRW